MRRLSVFFLFLCFANSTAGLLLAATEATGPESQDISFYTPAYPREPDAKQFYYNGRAFGVGPTSFAAIIDQIAKLPAGTSVVWGADYKRCGACGKNDLDSLPPALYPDLWKKLQTIVEQHNLRLSSAYPGPLPSLVGREQFTALPALVAPDSLSAERPFDAALDWQVREIAAEGGDASSSMLFADRYSAAGKELSGFDLELFFGRLPENSRVMVQITWGGETEQPKDGPRLRSWANHIGQEWRRSLANPLGQGKLTAVVTAPASLRGVLASAEDRQGLTIDWSNYRGPNTKHDEVLYLANGRFVGRGDEGFEHILAQMRKLPAYASIVLPRCEVGSRGSKENQSKSGLAAKDAALGNAVPFSARSSEFDALVREKNFAVIRAALPAGANLDATSLWGSGFSSLDGYVSQGRIIHHDEKPSADAARIGWVNMASDGKRSADSQSIITYNDQLLGADFVGFGRAMQKVWKLPKGSVVQVRVCLRTEGPFTCPVVYAGQRHFEVTGSEPYAPLISWLIEAARKRDLTIEWIPDEKVSAKDCALSR